MNMTNRTNGRTYLQSSFTKELVASSERDLNDASELHHVLRRVILDFRDTLGTT
jgi:hypothetical protein